VIDALWELVWAGEVTNDTLQPLRARLAPPRALRRPPSPARRRPIVVRGWHSPRSLPIGGDPQTAGRWYLVRDMVGESPSPTERLAATAQFLLDRFGIVTRETVMAADTPGGFSALYDVYRAMEDAGAARRGYFVAGLGAAQFAAPEVPDRLRSFREPGDQAECVLLASTDPANPYGAALPWPEREDGRHPARMAGTYVVLVDGALAAWVGRGERQVLTFLDAPASIACALKELVSPNRRRAIVIQDVDGAPVDRSPLAPALLDAGFTRMSRGYLWRV
jgi:ATP-dependent Lhr-like helicase